MAHKAPNPKNLTYLIQDSAVTSIRRFTKNGLIHVQDEHVREEIDAAIVCERKEGNEEYFWEDDRVYGIVQNLVVPIEEYFSGADRKFYAILRKSLDYQQNRAELACITIVDEAAYKISIRDNRWVHEKPERPAPRTLETKALESLGDMKISDSEVPPPPDTKFSGAEEKWLVYHTSTGETWNCDTQDAAKKRVVELILRGKLQQKLELYRNVPIHVELSVNVEVDDG